MVYNKQLSKNKSIEVQVSLFDSDLYSDIFELHIGWTTKQDHAGFRFIFSIYKFIFIQVMIYDHRHWDYDNNTWEDYNG
jgi:hypothetical protein